MVPTWDNVWSSVFILLLYAGLIWMITAVQFRPAPVEPLGLETRIP